MCGTGILDIFAESQTAHYVQQIFGFPVSTPLIPKILLGSVGKRQNLHYCIDDTRRSGHNPFLSHEIF